MSNRRWYDDSYYYNGYDEGCIVKKKLTDSYIFSSEDNRYREEIEEKIIKDKEDYLMKKKIRLFIEKNTLSDDEWNKRIAEYKIMIEEGILEESTITLINKTKKIKSYSDIDDYSLKIINNLSDKDKELIKIDFKALNGGL